MGFFQKGEDFEEFHKKQEKCVPSFDQKSGHFCIKNLKIFSLKNFPKKK